MFSSNTVGYEACTEKVVIETRSVCSQKSRKRKLRAKRRRRKKLFLKRRKIARYKLKKIVMDDCQDLMKRSEFSHMVHRKHFRKPTSLREAQYQDVAYWKARALSLEYENNMLYKYIHQMYTQALPEQEGDYNLYYEEEEEDEYIGEIEDEASNDYSVEENTRLKDKHKNSTNSESDSESKPSNEEMIKQRNEQMKILYGSASKKILGMETAMQLQFDHATKDGKVQFWPVVPLCDI